MIELIFEDRCTGCGDCVAACPSHVFDLSPGGTPVIARQKVDTVSAETVFGKV